MQSSIFLQEADGQDFVKSFKTTFKNCFEKALENLNVMMNSSPQEFYTRTKTNLLYNLIINQVKIHFPEVDGKIKILEQYESILLFIDGRATFRFKKLNEDGLPSNLKTDRNDAIIGQQTEIMFSEYPPIAFIDVGYQVNQAWTEYTTLKCLCRKNDNVIWEDSFLHTTGSKVKAVTDESTYEIPKRVKVKGIRK